MVKKGNFVLHVPYRNQKKGGGGTTEPCNTEWTLTQTMDFS